MEVVRRHKQTNKLKKSRNKQKNRSQIYDDEIVTRMTNEYIIGNQSPLITETQTHRLPLLTTLSEMVNVSSDLSHKKYSFFQWIIQSNQFHGFSNGFE